MNLLQPSIKIIKDNQHSSGAYIACPNFEVYKYCWLRDGSFIAYAMDKADETGSAELFYQWVNRVICNREEQIKELIAKNRDGQHINLEEYLPARYTLEGQMDNSKWGNFQLDGYGIWLWGLIEHIKITGRKELLCHYELALKLTVEYLSTFWKTPNYDCWEENESSVHPSTLACIAGGLKAINYYWDKPELEETIKNIEAYILNHFVTDGHLVKFQKTTEVDANLLWVALPFGILAVDDEIVKITVKKIESELCKDGIGVRRYLKDTYYSGGAWILLTAWLGWYYVVTGRRAEALRIKKWIEEQANSHGELPEQVLANPAQAEYYLFWRNKWGEVASPLLWSHAMYIVLCRDL